MEEVITKQLQKPKQMQLLLLKQLPAPLIKQEKILLEEIKTEQLQKMDIKTISEKIKAFEPLWFKKPRLPKYKLPSPPSETQIIPLVSLPTKKKKRPKRKKHIKKSPYEWFEYHPIPTLKEMFGIVGLPQQKPKQRTKAKHSTELTSVINQLIGKPKI